MADITVLRVEVANAGPDKEGSLKSGTGKNLSTNQSLAAGAIAGKAVNAKINSLQDELVAWDDAQVAAGEKGLSFGRAATRMGRLRERQQARLLISEPGQDRLTRAVFRKQYVRNISAPSAAQIKMGTKAVGGVATAAAAAYSLYSNYQKSGLEMSGATHAASIQGRKAEAANSLIGIGVAAMINPLLAAPMIAMKAWQLAQTNRKELFEIQKSQITSQVLQRNLIKTVAERRF